MANSIFHPIENSIKDFCEKKNLKIVFRNDGIIIFYGKRGTWFIERTTEDLLSSYKEFVYFFYCYCQDKYLEKDSYCESASIAFLNNKIALEAVDLAMNVVKEYSIVRIPDIVIKQDSLKTIHKYK